MLSHTGCAVGQVWLGAAPRENAAHRIRTLRRGAASQTRRWPTRDIRLSGFHAHQRQDPRRRVHHPPQNVAQEIPSPTRRTQRDAIAAMSRRPGAGRRVAAKCVSRLVSVLCCPRQFRTPAAVPRCDPSHVAAQPPASQPTRPPPDLGKVLQALQALASDSEDPSPLSQREVCMSTSKVRTVCGSSARTDLCGGRSERSSLPRLKLRIIRWSVAIGSSLLLALCASARAQQPAKIPRIGLLSAASPSSVSARVEAFRQGLRELGYVEGKKIFIEYRYSEGNLEQLKELATELVRLKLDLIVTAGPTATRLAKEATASIPIVMTQDTDPVGSGFVTSLARPGGNVTGFSTLSP